MGLTAGSVGRRAQPGVDKDLPENARLWLMVGNPNVGKSSLFNTLTGLHQHTGNWTGKTVGCKIGKVRHTGKEAPICLADLPGCYSIIPQSEEERAAIDFIYAHEVYGVIVVCDASHLERTLQPAFQLSGSLPKERIVICVNLIDELQKSGYTVDADALRETSGMHVVVASARSGQGINELLGLLHGGTVGPPIRIGKNYVESGIRYSAEIGACCRACVRPYAEAVRSKEGWKNALDSAVMGKWTAVPTALLFLSLILWLTIWGANIPSEWLDILLSGLGERLRDLPIWSGCPAWIPGLLIDGIYQTAATVTSVMLPPMAIFFPLFTLLEDFGFLPRIAFNFDRCFSGCGTCGKQALTMCMGLGCNAAGVTGCRIIQSPRERLIAVLTNSLMPCNGKFPTVLLMCACLFLCTSGMGGMMYGMRTLLCCLMVTGLLILCAGMTLLVSRMLSCILKAGNCIPFLLELPPYRKPVISQVLVRSLLDRTLYVLGRAVSVAGPMGGVIWLADHIRMSDGSTFLQLVSTVTDPIGRILCLDGVVVVSLILSLPANELTLPLMLTIYGQGGSGTAAGDLLPALTSCGWDAWTFAAFLFLFVFHVPCSTTLITVYKETGKKRCVLAAALIPPLIGVTICLIIRLLRWLIDGGAGIS